MVEKITKNMLKKLSSVVWEINQNARINMRVPARIYATERML